jgi:hypothetical protein
MIFFWLPLLGNFFDHGFPGRAFKIKAEKEKVIIGTGMCFHAPKIGSKVRTDSE